MKSISGIMKVLGACGFLILSVSCSHSVKFRSAHFAVPYVSDKKQFSGEVAAVVANPTKVTFVDDISSNPPSRGTLGINDDVDLGDVLLLSTFAFDLNVQIISGFEFYLENGLYGGRWQFLNYGSQKNVPVASIQAGAEFSAPSTKKNDDEATSDVRTKQVGASLGYKAEKAIFYLSYVRNFYEVSTEVTNTHGNFGPYEDKGVHDVVGVGAQTYGDSFVVGLEYNIVHIRWNNDVDQKQYLMGGRLGLTW